MKTFYLYKKYGIIVIHVKDFLKNINVYIA